MAVISKRVSFIGSSVTSTGALEVTAEVSDEAVVAGIWFISGGWSAVVLRMGRVVEISPDGISELDLVSVVSSSASIVGAPLLNWIGESVSTFSIRTVFSSTVAGAGG